MKCKIEGCNKQAIHRYCGPIHAAIGLRNAMVKYEAKRQGKGVGHCSTPDCHRHFVIQKSVKTTTCYTCRKPLGCAFCGGKIPAGRSGKSLYCSVEHRIKQQRNGRTIAYAKKKGMAVHTCSAPGCGLMFTSKIGTETECRPCRKKTPLAPNRENTEICDGKTYSDFRSTVCFIEGKRPQCANFSKCSDSVIKHSRGKFEYQTNGGKDCWVAPVVEHKASFGSAWK